MAATGTPINTTFTRGERRIRVSGVPNGDYTIEIVVRDYEPIRESVRDRKLRNGGAFPFFCAGQLPHNFKIQATIPARTECSKQSAR